MAVSLVVLRVADRFLAVDVAFARSVLMPLPITPVPGSAPHVAGVANIDGSITAILDLGARLGIARTEPEGRLCVIDTAFGSAALQVDDVLEVVTVDEQELEPEAASPWILGVCKASLTHYREEPLQTIVLVIDPEAVCGAAA